MPAKVKSTFECIVTIEGVDAPYKVTLTSVDSGTGHFDFENAKPIIDTSKVVAFITEQLQSQGLSGVDVGCGDAKVRVVDIGDTIDCTISDDQDTQTVQAVVEDLEGTVSVKG